MPNTIALSGWNTAKTLSLIHIYSSMVNNAYLIELLSNVPGNPPQEGMCMRREVALSVYDSVARIVPEDMPQTKYWNKVRGRKDGVLLMRDNSSAPMIHLLPRFMKTNNITDGDLAKLTNGKSLSAAESWVNGIKVLAPTDITCKNGYVPVSYTHLDVYTRQVPCRPRARSWVP